MGIIDNFYPTTSQKRIQMSVRFLFLEKVKIQIW